MKKYSMNIDYLSKLANISLTSYEKVKISVQLRDVVKFIDNLNEVNSENVSVLPSSVTLINIFRDDAVEEGLNQNESLNAASEKIDNYFKVQQILKNRGVK